MAIPTRLGRTRYSQVEAPILNHTFNTFYPVTDQG